MKSVTPPPDPDFVRIFLSGDVMTGHGKGRVLFVAAAFEDSGVPPGWRAEPKTPGVNLVEPTKSAAAALAGRLSAPRRPGDVSVASIHWGSNWGYEVPQARRRFARALIDSGQVDVLHGHSSHHPRPIEVYRDRLILYGCGDFLNDYEGIGGYDAYRSDPVAMYFADVDPATGALVRLFLTPMTVRRFGLHRASAQDADWLGAALTRESRWFGVDIARAPDGRRVDAGRLTLRRGKLIRLMVAKSDSLASDLGWNCQERSVPKQTCREADVAPSVHTRGR